MSIETNLMELHLGILNQKLARLKAKMNISFAKSQIEDAKKKGIDKQEEERIFELLSKNYSLIEKEIEDYESKVLELTKL